MVDLLSATAADLRNLLQTNQVSSVDLVKAYMRQIIKYDGRLKALISLAPEEDVIASAAALDKERLEGRERSQLHGIPIVLKVHNPTKSCST